MKVEVHLGKALPAVAGAPHLAYVRAQPCNVRGGTAPRGQCGRGRLERPPHFRQALQEVVVEPDAHPPREHVGVEEIPVHRVADARADARLRDHEAFRGEGLHDLAQHRARDLKALDELGLGRHVGAGAVDALEDLGAQNRRDLVVARHRPFLGETAQTRVRLRRRAARGYRGAYQDGSHWGLIGAPESGVAPLAAAFGGSGAG